MKFAILAAAVSAFFLCKANAIAPAPAWGQCGGSGWSGPTVCTGGFICTYCSPFYSTCNPITTSTTATDPLPTSPPSTVSPTAPVE